MMKRITLLVACCIALVTFVKAQVPPNAFNYSAVARNVSGQPIASTAIGIQISILKTSASGSTVYVENHFLNTDDFGLFNLIVGSGAVLTGSIDTIDWSIDNYYLQVGMDAGGGTNFLTMGITQLLSVPYALYAKSAGSVSGGVNENDPVFGSSVAGSITSSDTANWNNKQEQLVAGSNITIAGNTISAASIGGGFTHYIGEEFGGGVVFHLFKDAQGVEHGLIVDKTDLSLSQVWSNIDQTGVGPAAQSLWDGLNNSNAIVSQGGHTSSAAALCMSSTNGGQSDWYLPSIQELSLIWKNIYDVTRSLSQVQGATGLQAANYWSSTETFVDAAWYFGFDYGFVGNEFSKSTTKHVRAVRAF